MRIVVLCGSPKGDKSDTSVLTRAFLCGMGEEAEWIYAYRAGIAPCRGCFACWHETPGRCVIRDDMDAVMDAVCLADLVIWSTPQYCYGLPGPLKTLLDRLLPLSTAAQAETEEGQIYHPKRVELPRMMLIAGCGFPDRKLNSEALLGQFALHFGSDCPVIYCAEAPLLNMPSAGMATRPYLAAVERAGAEFAAEGRISAETQAVLDRPMMPRWMYTKMVNAAAENG